MSSIRKIYYRVVNYSSDICIPPDSGEFQLIDKVLVDYLRQFDDYYPYLRGMIASCGFNWTSIEYTWKKRQKGFSKNTLYALVDQGLNGMISFSRVPLRISMFIGFLLSFLSISYAIVSLVYNLIYYRAFAAPGIATLIIALFFFSGVQLFFIGFLGEYISAIHYQVRKRPLVMEKERINFDKKEIQEL
jgi:hypothetical protein